MPLNCSPCPTTGWGSELTGYPLTDKQREHLNHMTDGRWHDSCPMCLRRRVNSGTGIPEYDAYLRRTHPELAAEPVPTHPEEAKP